MEIPSIQKMTEAGMHFGHQVSKRHPKMQPYIFGVRKGINIINLETTQKKLEEALAAVKDLVSGGKTILFIGTKKQIAPIIEKYAKECGMPYVSTRWLGGTLTNFPSILGLIKKFRDLRSKQEKGELEKYTKKEQSKFKKDIEKMKGLVGGLSALERIPDALFITDLKTDKTAFVEAMSKKIPSVAICDTNVNPTKVKYVIPANDDSVGSVELITSAVAEAVKAGKASQKSETNSKS
jgi:small subunit ribosomal protein S2